MLNTSVLIISLENMWFMQHTFPKVGVTDI